MALKAVIFDMDGVIVDTEPEYIRTTALMLKKYKHDVDECDLEKYKGIDSLDMWQDIKKSYALEASAQELFSEEKETIEEHYRKGDLQAITPTASLIKKINKKGYKTAVASSSEKKNILQVLERLALSPYFDIVVSRNDVDKGKPAPDIYLLTARQLGVSPHECVVIEDSIAGTQSAKSAGMKVIRYVGEAASHRQECNADRIVNDIREITLSLLREVAASH